MICPVCRTDAEPFVTVGSVAVCVKCGATNVIEANGTVRRARHDDIAAMADEQTQALREARRGKVRRR